MTEMDTHALGAQLRALRAARKLSLRDVERSHSVNTGYLSQLERGEIANPSPAILKRLAAAYDEPVVLLMYWAGYIEDTDVDAKFTPNQRRALRYLGDDPTDQEVATLKAVLDVLRSEKSQ